MEITGPVPQEVLAKKMGISIRTLKSYLATIRSNSPELLDHYTSKGIFPGFKKIVLLYDYQLIGIIEQLRPVAKTATVTPAPAPEPKKQKPVVQPKEPESISPDTIITAAGNKSEYKEKKQDGYFNKTVDWNSVFLILEAGASLEEAAGYLRVDQLWLAAKCQEHFKISFTQLKNYCFYSGNVKIKLSMYSSAVGTKERKANPLIQILMAKDRLGLGTKDMDEPTNPQDIIYMDGKEYNLNEMGDQELQKRRRELEEKIQAIKEGKKD